MFILRPLLTLAAIGAFLVASALAEKAAPRPTFAAVAAQTGWAR